MSSSSHSMTRYKYMSSEDVHLGLRILSGAHQFQVPVQSDDDDMSDSLCCATPDLTAQSDDGDRNADSSNCPFLHGSTRTPFSPSFWGDGCRWYYNILKTRKRDNFVLLPVILASSCSLSRAGDNGLRGPRTVCPTAKTENASSSGCNRSWIKEKKR